MKETKYIRTGNRIKNVETGAEEQYKSTNKAKKASWKIQMDADRSLGLGTVRVER